MEKDFWEKISTIYNHISDNDSKKIFELRLLYNTTGDDKYIEEIIDKTIEYNSQYNGGIYNFVNRARSNKWGGVVVYGAGSGGELIQKYLDKMGVKILAYCDRDAEKQKKGLNGYDVLSLEELQVRFPDAYILICVFNIDVNQSIKTDLTEAGFHEEKIAIAADYMGKQYFDTMIPKKEGLFLDCGGYDLNSTLEYLAWNEYPGNNIICFEPDFACYKMCLDVQERKKLTDRVRIINKGIWSEEKTLQFNVKNDGTTIVCDGGTELSVTTIDKTVKGEKVGFIKMDVEGSELEGLRGAADTIRRDHPVLAICIYHKKEDIVAIPDYILKLDDTYRFYIRHYATCASETVLYAI